MDASVFKSVKLNWFKKPAYLALSLNVTNVLDKQDHVSGGFEQLRFDFVEKDVNRFPSKYYYFSGFNYYFNASIRF
jgi:outer membrane receptor protein involved in Fe transport